MAKDIAWAADDFLKSVKEVVDKEFPDSSEHGSDAYLNAIVRSYLGHTETSELFHMHSKGKAPSNDSEHTIELLGLVRYLDKKVKHLEKALDRASGAHGVGAFPDHDDVQEMFLRGYVDLEALFPKGGSLVSAPRHTPSTSSITSTDYELSLANFNGVIIENDQSFTFDIDRVIVPFDSKEGSMEKDWLHLQFLVAKDEKALNTFVNPSNLPSVQLDHVANEMRKWHEQAGRFRPCIGNANDPLGTVRVHYLTTRQRGVWKGMGLRKDEYACLDCLVTRRHCVVFRADKRQKIFKVLPLPPFARGGHNPEKEEYWRIDASVKGKMFAHRWRPMGSS